MPKEHSAPLVSGRRAPICISLRSSVHYILVVFANRNKKCEAGGEYSRWWCRREAVLSSLFHATVQILHSSV